MPRFPCTTRELTYCSYFFAKFPLGRIKTWIQAAGQGARSEFWGVASRVPSLQATLPPFPQIFSVISDTSCHIPYLFFKNTNCVTPSQIIFANLRRFPQNFDFPKTLICSNCKTKRYFENFFKLMIWLISCRYYFFLCKQKLKYRKWRTVP